MKIEILKDQLEKVSGTVSRVTNKNLSLPVLGCAVFVVASDRAVLRSTNLDVSVELVLKAKIFEEGVVAVPAHILYQTVSAFSDTKLTLELKDNTLHIKGERGVSTIAVVDASDFPTLPYVKQGEGVTVMIDTQTLISSIKTVSFAAASSGMKPELNSISLSLEEGILIGAATDSFRLAEMKNVSKNKGSFGPTLLPARNVSDIIRMLDGSSTVEVRVSENQCTFINDGGYITSRIIDGAFPVYSAIIPKEYATQVTVLREDVVRAFKKVSIFSDSFHQVKLIIHPSKKVFSIQSSNTGVGSTDESIPAAIEGDPLEINFNAKYITDALGALTADSITFSIAGPGKPMVIEDSPRRGFLYLVMPMNR